MAAKKDLNYDPKQLEALRYAVHGISAPFVCGGTFVPEQPVTIGFPDKTQIPVLRANNTFEQVELLRPLMKRCEPAPFGKGRKTRYDRSVREALQLKAEGGAFSVLNFDPAAAGILEQIRRTLTPQVSQAPTAELYNLNIYESGGHFAPHKDTPRGGDMLGTLVVCLPSQFSRGAFVVKHQGIFETYDWGSAIRQQDEPARIHWAAFFGDVDHQIEQVWGGLRVTLTYLLRSAAPADHEAAVERDSSTSIQSVEAVGPVRQTLRTLLADRRFLPRGGTLAFPCSHLYHQDARFQRKQKPLSRQTATALKGRDYDVAAAALAEGLTVTLCPYLVETCVDEAWQLEHFPTERERTALDDEVTPDDLEHTLAIRDSAEDAHGFDLIWVDPPPHFNGAPTMYPNLAEGRAPVADPDVPALAHFHSCEYSATGYFGNEGSYVDFYVYGALHVDIPPLGEAARTTAKAKPARKSASATRKRK